MKPVIRYALAALLLLASSFSHSATLFYVNVSPYTAFPTRDLACSNRMADFSTAASYSFTTSGGTYNLGNCSVYRASGSTLQTSAFGSRDDDCPSGYTENSSGLCELQEEQPTCEKDSDSFSSWLTLGQLDTGNYWTIPKNGCAYAMSSTDSCYELTSGEKGCNVTFSQTEIPTSDLPDGGSNLPTDSEDVPSKDQSEGTTDSRENTSETQTSNEPTITNPDGSTVDSTTTQTTTTTSAGTSIVVGDNTITITDSDGTITTYSENKTTVTHHDGSVTETINKDSAVKTPDKTTTVITKQPPSTITNNTTGNTTTYNEWITNYYDSSGNKTGSESGSSGDEGSNGDEGNPEEEGNCGAPGQPDCSVTMEDTSSEYGDNLADLNDAENELAAERQKIVEELGDTTNDFGLSTITGFTPEAIVTRFLPLPTSVSCNGITTSFSVSSGSYGFNFQPCEKLESLREVLAWVFFIYTVFAVLNITLGRKLF